MPKTIKTILLVLIVLSTNIVFAQKKLKLSNIETGAVIILKEGTRVACLPKKHVIIMGNLKVISDSTIQIGKDIVQIKNIKALNQRKLGTSSIFLLSFFVCAFAVDFFVVPDDQPEVIRAPVGIALLALIGYSMYISEKNAPIDVTREWKLQVIE